LQGVQALLNQGDFNAAGALLREAIERFSQLPSLAGRLEQNQTQRKVREIMVERQRFYDELTTEAKGTVSEGAGSL
jgi:hypothetical protein